MQIIGVAAPFNATLVVKVDGITVQTITEPTVAEGAYTERVISLPANVADGGSHVIRFEYNNPAGSGTSSFLVDDITLDVSTGQCATPTPTPTVTPTPTPTPNVISIQGRVLTPTFLGLRDVRVRLIDTAGNTRIATTSSFGVYSFTDLPPGLQYTLTAQNKRYRFAPRVEVLTTSVTNYDLIGLE